MSNKLAAFLLLLFFNLPAAAQTGAYPPRYDARKPNLIELWTRLADHSPALQSAEAVEFSPDGQLVTSGGKFGYQVILWRLMDGATLGERAHESEVECLTFSPDGSLLATGGEDSMPRLWDVATGEQVHAIEHPSGLDGLTWNHDGKILATAYEDNGLITLHLFETHCKTPAITNSWRGSHWIIGTSGHVTAIER